jgi:hypothetical protein
VVVYMKNGGGLEGDAQVAHRGEVWLGWF